MKIISDDIVYFSKHTIEKSVFITLVKKIKSKVDLIDFITNYTDNKASHNVIAYRYRENDNLYLSYKEDGEPYGTSGKSLLNVIETVDLENVIVLVKRYYGGKKLGKALLSRAYRKGFLYLLGNDIRLENKINTLTARIKFHIKNINKVNYILSNNKIVIIKKTYVDKYCKMEISLPMETNLLEEFSNLFMVEYYNK
ncbi:YigZ family protein [Spiroplasma endosymbiont of Aspidapion aeneum]|uniref:YigZ family protein n=1 Tax=Spiroplasma endosymbiont of Aspidapion aeneum TaxID=3066276 RepID=UPI00313ACBFE